jgi:hypothetical protein
MEWIILLVFSASFFVTSNSFKLNSGVHLKSNDFLSNKSLNFTEFEKRLGKIDPNKVIDNNEVSNKLKRNEDVSYDSTNEDSVEVHYNDYVYYDEDYDDDDDDDDNGGGGGGGGGDDGDDDDDGHVSDGDGDGESDDKENDGNEQVNGKENDNDENHDVSKYLYDYVDDNGIANEDNNGSKFEKVLLRVPRLYVFESSDDRNKQRFYYMNDNANRGNDHEKNYAHDEIINQDNDDVNKEDHDDNDAKHFGVYDGDSVRNAHEEDRTTSESEKGTEVVADRVMDSIQRASNIQQDGRPKCSFGWRPDANGLCAPSRSLCEPGFVRNKAGNCVMSDRGHWYK